MSRYEFLQKSNIGNVFLGYSMVIGLFLSNKTMSIFFMLVSFILWYLYENWLDTVYCRFYVSPSVGFEQARQLVERTMSNEEESM